MRVPNNFANCHSVRLIWAVFGSPSMAVGNLFSSNLALGFLRLQTGNIVHLCFGVIVGMKPASANKHKQDEAKRQNQHYFTVVLELAEDWNQTTHMKRPP